MQVHDHNYETKHKSHSIYEEHRAKPRMPASAVEESVSLYESFYEEAL